MSDFGELMAHAAGEGFDDVGGYLAARERARLGYPVTQAELDAEDINEITNALKQMENQILELMRALLATNRAAIPGLTTLTLSVNDGTAKYHHWTAHGVGSTCSVGHTTAADAIKAVELQLGPISELPSELRRRAAALEREAAALELAKEAAQS